MSEHVQLLAKNIEIKTLQGTVVQLSHDLAHVTHEHGTLKAAYNQLHENALKQADEMSKANVALVLEKNTLIEAQTNQKNRIVDTDEVVVGLKHQLEREQIIHDHIFAEIRNGSELIMLPGHHSLGKVKKASLRVETEGQTLSGIVTYIDNLYQQIDNPELRRLLRA